MSPLFVALDFSRSLGQCLGPVLSLWTVSCWVDSSHPGFKASGTEWVSWVSCQGLVCTSYLMVPRTGKGNSKQHHWGDLCPGYSEEPSVPDTKLRLASSIRLTLNPEQKPQCGLVKTYRKQSSCQPQRTEHQSTQSLVSLAGSIVLSHSSYWLPPNPTQCLADWTYRMLVNHQLEKTKHHLFSQTQKKRKMEVEGKRLPVGLY